MAKVPRLHLTIVGQIADVKGFAVLPRRWVVERTFRWFSRNRRLANDFEDHAKTLATLASIQLAVRRLALGVGRTSTTLVGTMAGPAASGERRL